MTDRIIYFDNAATTFPKPQGVLDTFYDCAANWCGNAGRGSHPIAMRSAEAIYSTRESLASLFGASAENVVFSLNTTYALNLAIKGTMRRGGHVLISDLEHNSTLRPVAQLMRERKISYDVFPTQRGGAPLPTAEIILGIISRLRRDTRMICAIHTSNICSYSLPISEIGALCRRHGLLFCVDAAQAAGHCEINMAKDHIDVLCLPGHKGLYAPQGVGAVILGENVTLDTLIEGGNGVNSRELSMGLVSPERYEGGTLCTPAIVGLNKGVEFIQGLGISTIAAHEKELYKRAYFSLSEIDGMKIYSRESGSILLFNMDGIHPDEVGEELGKRGICVRTGYHCSPLAHKALETADGGAVRVSFSVFNTEKEIDELCAAVKSLAVRAR